MAVRLYSLKESIHEYPYISLGKWRKHKVHIRAERNITKCGVMLMSGSTIVLDFALDSVLCKNCQKRDR